MSRSAWRLFPFVLVLSFLLLGSARLEAQTQPAYLVRDINATPGGHAFVEHTLSYGAPGPPWVEHEGVLLLGADDGISRGLWRSDGTPEGTFLVRQLPSGGFLPFSWPTPLDGAVVFSSGTSLWKTDGTFEGTEIVDSSLLEPAELTLFDGSAYFRARTPETGTELWKSDGTEAGTALVKDIHPGNDFQGFPNSSTPLELTVSGGSLFFTANHDGMNRNLWKSDGTESGTVRVYSAPPGSFYSPSELFDNEGTLFFASLTPEFGYEPWKSNGTEAGTVLLKDITPGELGSGSFFGGPAPLPGGLVLFAASDGVSGLELWKSDGTEAGTVRVKDIFPGIVGSEPRPLIVIDGRAYFAADDGVHGRELWMSDGTEDGTRLVEDLSPGASFSGIANLYAVGSILVFTANDGVHGGELWRSDGTTLGTRMLQDIAPGPGTSEPKQFQPLGPNLYFSANDGVHGREMWALPKTALLSTFADVPATSSVWPFVEALAGAGITAGCAPGLYCPWNNVSRAEMAVFLVRGTHGPDFVPPPATGTVFTDVSAGYWAAAWIEQLVADGLTGGCGVAPARYCPAQPLTRASMAIFLLRAKHGSGYTPPPATGTVFTDVPASHWAAPWIEQLAAEGITAGCATGRYCPGDSVNRAQTAVFLTRTFDLPLR
jgi:ELWxxDGT repeat protein